MFSNIFDVKVKNVANTNVMYGGGKLLALWEGGLPYRLEPDTLRTVGEYKLKGLLKSSSRLSAHPRYDAKTGRTVIFANEQGPSKCVTSIFELDSNLNAIKQRTIEFPGFVFYHDFIVTENYYIFNKAPLDFSPLDFLLGKVGPAQCIKFDKSKPATLYLVPRDGTSPVQEVNVDAHFNFHFANAYEENKKIIFDVVWCNNMQLGTAQPEGDSRPVWETIDYGKEVPFSTLMRYTLTQNEGSGWSYARSQLSKYSTDFTSVNPTVSCSKHRYVYGACGRSLKESSPVQGLLKVDTESVGDDVVWYGKPHEYLGEPIFVQKKDRGGMSGNALAEDEGYLLSYLFNGQSKSTEFVVFDAQDIKKGPVVRVKLPTALPFGLHGSFVQGLTFDADELLRRWKAYNAIESKQWNEVNGGFSGLGLVYDL